ncbi:MAG: AIR synthase-related protein, partial [Oscillospiraceae bacterium]
HPTEIEPFGGAATCLGGAIRDPLSGRSYVYQAMRVTGASDPLVRLNETIKGKLPQKKITLGAASGYSSYGNQIGLATGLVDEIYHPGYVAKRMEVGAVIAAAPEENVRREIPCAGDVIILLGGKTGRDGCGGATGSSKSHNLQSLENCGAEVQKGNAPEERKIQRLFRNKAATTLIKRCNDFGAGGVSVAIGELADGLIINLDKVTKKYEGLDGTELAISESQERMAVVVEKENAVEFLTLAGSENLEATIVAEVTQNPRLVMNWNGNEIVNLSREFINSNGASKSTDIFVDSPKFEEICCNGNKTFTEKITALVSDLNICSKKGLSERFDSTIGASTVLMPFGGKYQMTPIQAMVAKIPLEKADTTTCSVMAYGFDPYLSSQSPYHGAICAVVESVAKVVAAGGDHEMCWLSFQEYFERTKHDPKRWGKPFSALLGSFEAQLGLGVAAIGGKDSMSGTFEEIDVPPTLISFAVSVANSKEVCSPEFKKINSNVYYIAPKYDEKNLPCFESVKDVFSCVKNLIKTKKATSVYAVSAGGIGEAVFKMSLGNKIGFQFNNSISKCEIFKKCYGGFIVETNEEIAQGILIGKTTIDYNLKFNDEKVCLQSLQKSWENKLESVFPAYKEVEN